VSGPVTSVARVEDVQIFLKEPVFYISLQLIGYADDINSMVRKKRAVFLSM
jgi:hypothetical protein